jgi:GNAT superfamily N-acetyltransferase
VKVRKAAPGDSQRLAALMHQLGYDVSADELAKRLSRQGGRRDVFVAVDGIAEIVGWVAVCVDETFVEGHGAQIEGLVVDERERRRGAGAALLDAAEAWARRRGCSEVRVQSNVIRTRAHAFYTRQGYARVKAQYQLRKRL